MDDKAFTAANFAALVARVMALEEKMKGPPKAEEHKSAAAGLPPLAHSPEASLPGPDYNHSISVGTTPPKAEDAKPQSLPDPVVPTHPKAEGHEEHVADSSHV